MFILFLARLKRNGRYRKDLLDSEKMLKSIRQKVTPADLQEWIGQALQHPFWEVRTNAVKIIGLTRMDFFCEKLSTLLLTKRELGFIRRNAATSLGQIGVPSERVLDALIAALSDPYWEVRGQAAIALSKLGKPDPQIEQMLLKMLFRKPLEQIRNYPILFPGRIFREKNFEVRATLISALGTFLSDPNNIRALEILMQDDSWKVRSTAIQAYRISANRLGVAQETIISRLKSVDMTCADFAPAFPIRRVVNENIEIAMSEPFDNNGGR